MAPQIENIDDVKLEYAPGRKLRVRRFVPMTENDFIVDDGAGTRSYTGFFKPATAGIMNETVANQAGFYSGTTGGNAFNFVQGNNLYVRRSNNLEVIVVNIV